MSALWERFRKYPRNWIILAVTLVLISLVARMVYSRVVDGRPWAERSGFGEYIGDLLAEDRGKTLWDWIELLIIPAILGVGTILVNKSQKPLLSLPARNSKLPGQ